MDYKITVLKEELKTEENFLPEIQNLHFGLLKDHKAVFDYTAYIEEGNLPPIDYKVFMRMNKHFIETLAKTSGNKTSELFYQNTNGHILIAAELTFICLAYINPEMFLYFNGIVADAISNGVAFSDGFIYDKTAQRLPTETLNDIIKERENDTEGSE